MIVFINTLLTRIPKLIFILCLVICKPFIAYSQDTTLYAYSENDKKVFCTSLQSIFTGNQPVSYFAWMPAFLPIERPIPLSSNEGKYGYLFEGKFDQSYTIYQGRSSSNYFFQTTRISFKYAPTLRLTFDMNNYLLPTNQKVGGQIDKVIWDNHTNNILFQKNNDSIGIDKISKPIKMIYFSFTGMHYSNGLILKPVFYDSLHIRNNYQSGYFSTNYFQLMAYYAYLDNKLLTVGLGYQYDVSGMPEQWNRYGQHRICMVLQSRSKPRIAFFNFIPALRTITETDIHTHKKYTLKRLWEHRIRIESEYILGNLTDFNRSNAYRFSSHFYYEILPLRSRSVGAFFHVYYGRDYLNIRYDDVVFGLMGGLTLAIDKYKCPQFSEKQYIVNTH